MKLSFRWYGPEDPVSLAYIRQIPHMAGIVSALHDLQPGAVWPLDRLLAHKAAIEDAGLSFAVVESIPVHEDIKLGRPTRDQLIENYCESVANMGAAGIPVLCYNFMAVFDWFRTDLAMVNPDASTALSFSQRELEKIDLSQGTGFLPGWGTAFTAEALQSLMAAYADVDEERLWDNLGYFLERVVPVAAAAGVNMAIHPDDPPWSVFGLPRIITSGNALERLTDLVDDPSNGVTLCSGSLGASPENDVPEIIRSLGKKGRIHFSHCRNVKVTGPRTFHESPHPAGLGSVDMREVMQAYADINFTGPLRPDHGRMIWGETGKAGYGLYDRALGAMYLQGIWEGLQAG